MRREVMHGVVGARLIAVGIADQGTWIVGHDQLWHAAEEDQRGRGGVEPVSHGFTRRRAGIGVARRPQRRHEEMGTPTVRQR